MLDAAGWKPGGDGVRVKNGQRLAGSIVEIDGDVDQRHALCESLQEQARAIGMDLSIQYLAPGPRSQAYNSSAYNMTLDYAVSSDPDILSTSFHSKNLPPRPNRSWVSIKQLDDWLDAGAQEPDTAKRIAIYAQVQEFMMMNAMVLPIFVSTYTMAGRSYVQGLKFDPRAYPVFYDIFLNKQ